MVNLISVRSEPLREGLVDRPCTPVAFLVVAQRYTCRSVRPGAAGRLGRAASGASTHARTHAGAVAGQRARTGLGRRERASTHSGAGRDGRRGEGLAGKDAVQGELRGEGRSRARRGRAGAGVSLDECDRQGLDR